MTNQELGSSLDGNQSINVQQGLLDLLDMTRSQLALIKGCEEIEEETIADFDQITGERQEKLDQISAEYEQNKSVNSAEIDIQLRNILKEIQAIDTESSRILQDSLNRLGQKIGQISSNRKANSAYEAAGTIGSIFVDRLS